MTGPKSRETKYSLSQVYFYLTEGCNLACRHCWLAPQYQPGENKSAVLDFELFRSILEQAKPLGLTTVKLTGGEPLMHPRIREILSLVRTSGFRLVIETNGVLCTAEIAKLIASCRNPFVSVSLDGVDAATHEWVRGVAGCFESALAGIHHLVRSGLKPQIIMSLMQRNKLQVEGMVHLAEFLEAGSVKFNPVQPVERGMKMHESDEALDVHELVDLGRWVDTKLSAATKLHLFFHYPAAFRSFSRIFSHSDGGCGTCGIKRIIGVLSNGCYALCGIGTSVDELVFGHAGKDTLANVWYENPILNRIRAGVPDNLEGICRNCILKNLCLGSCIAQNYYRTKNLFAPFWLCEEAYKEGLFPRSRISATTTTSNAKKVMNSTIV